MNAAAIIAILEKIVTYGPTLVQEGTVLVGSLRSLADVVSGKVSGDDAKTVLANVEADIDAHIDHIDAEAAKLLGE